MGKKIRKNNENIFEIRRQIFHMIVGLSISLFLLIFGRASTLIVCSLILMLGVYIKHKVEKKKYVKIISTLLDIFEREKDKENPGKGAMLLIMGIIATLILYETKPAFYSILIVSISDAFSTIIGKAFGKKRKWNKSFAGSFAFFLSAYAILFYPYGLYYSFFVAIIGTITEALPKLDDNFSIPIAVGFFLQIA